MPVSALCLLDAATHEDRSSRIKTRLRVGLRRTAQRECAGCLFLRAANEAQRERAWLGLSILRMLFQQEHCQLLALGCQSATVESRVTSRSIWITGHTPVPCALEQKHLVTVCVDQFDWCRVHQFVFRIAVVVSPTRINLFFGHATPTQDLINDTCRIRSIQFDAWSQTENERCNEQLLFDPTNF